MVMETADHEKGLEFPDLTVKCVECKLSMSLQNLQTVLPM